MQISDSAHPVEVVKKDNKSNKQVQTEIIFYPYNCFYCESRLETKDLVKSHAEVCHGRRLTSFSCEQCSKNFDDASELKSHVVKVHDPAKLLNCLQNCSNLKIRNSCAMTVDQSLSLIVN